MISSNLSFAFFTSVALGLTSGTALSHTFGNGQSDLTPPIIAYADEIEALQKDFGGAAPSVRGVFLMTNLWNAGSILKACFYDGESRLKAFFVRAAQKWLLGTSLKVDFGGTAGLRVCGSGSMEDIRITFAKKGNWSFIGTASNQPSTLEQGASLNIQTDGRPFESLNLEWLEETSLHEFGHALGLLHEHQSPAAKCGDEFDWPKVFAYAKENWRWDEEKVNVNFAPYFSEARLRMTPYDRSSIMHYALADWMFKKGKKSRCYISQPKTISKMDRATILDAYPSSVTRQDKELQNRAALVGTIIGRLNLNAGQLASVGAKIAASMTHFNRKLSLQFAAAENGIVRRSGDGSLTPCEGENLKIPSAPNVSCGVVPDGSGFVIETNSDSQRP